MNQIIHYYNTSTSLIPSHPNHHNHTSITSNLQSLPTLLHIPLNQCTQLKSIIQYIIQQLNQNIYKCIPIININSNTPTFIQTGKYSVAIIITLYTDIYIRNNMNAITQYIQNIQKNHKHVIWIIYVNMELTQNDTCILENVMKRIDNIVEYVI